MISESIPEASGTLDLSLTNKTQEVKKPPPKNKNVKIDAQASETANSWPKFNLNYAMHSKFLFKIL